VDVPERYRRLTLRHCLTMATGHDTEAWTDRVKAAAQQPLGGDDDGDPVLAAILAHPPEHDPGTAWAYNQVATYLAAGAVRGVTGSSVLALLRQRVLPLLDPAGADGVRWHRTATGRELGFSGIHVGTDAVLALAQTYLDRGTLGGERVLSREWVTTATTPTGLPNREAAPNPDWVHGYGCSFWGASHGYRGDGAYGQFAIVLPAQDVALALTAETTDLQGVLDLVWEHLLPALDRPGDAAADAALADRLAALHVPTPRSAATGPSDGAWVRSPDSDLPEAYAAVQLAHDGDAAYRLYLDVHGDEVTLQVGDGHWRESVLAARGRELPVAAAGGWAEDGTFRADLRLVETPHTVRVRTRPDGTVHLGWRLVPMHGPDPLDTAVRGPALPPQD
jgi:hypothetical protein